MINRQRLFFGQIELVITIIGFFILSTVCSDSVFACECSHTREINEELQESHAIFSGKAIAVDSYTFGRATFEVYQVWRGDVPTRIVISNAYQCDDAFEIGQEYLVFAHKVKGKVSLDLTAGGCGQTLPLEKSQKALDVLGAGSSPKETNKHLQWGVVVLCGLLLIGTSIILARKLRGSTAA